MGDEQYLSRIRQLESEIEYLHGLLDNAGIPYKREAKELDDLSPDRNLAFEEDQGARIQPEIITKQVCGFAATGRRTGVQLRSFG